MEIKHYSIVGTVKDCDIVNIVKKMSDSLWDIEEFETVDYIILKNDLMTLQIHPSNYPSKPRTFSFMLLGNFKWGLSGQKMVHYFIEKLYQNGFVFSLKININENGQALEHETHTHKDW